MDGCDLEGQVRWLSNLDVRIIGEASVLMLPLSGKFCFLWSRQWVGGVVEPSPTLSDTTPPSPAALQWISALLHPDRFYFTLHCLRCSHFQQNSSWRATAVRQRDGFSWTNQSSALVRHVGLVGNIRRPERTCEVCNLLAATLQKKSPAG